MILDENETDENITQQMTQETAENEYMYQEDLFDTSELQRVMAIDQKTDYSEIYQDDQLPNICDYD